MLFVFFIVLKIVIIEGRVYCQDTQAAAWRAIGFSCPVTCRIIVSAVDRLKQIDLEHLINLQSGNSLKPDVVVDIKAPARMRPKSILSYKPIHDHPEGKTAQTYESFMKIVQTEQFFADFKIELSNLTDVFNVSCYIMANKTRLFRQVLNDCTMGGKPKGYILDRFMEFLNKYADAEYGFDIGMTLIILKHLLSTSNFRYGMMEALIMYMKTALKPEDTGLATEEVIKISPKHCLSMFVPGCYCNKGFVELKGRCVRPEECSNDPLFTSYLYRIDLN